MPCNWPRIKTTMLHRPALPWMTVHQALTAARLLLNMPTAIVFKILSNKTRRAVCSSPEDSPHVILELLSALCFFLHFLQQHLRQFLADTISASMSRRPFCVTTTSQ
jgi:hypothetical protein